MHVAGKERMTVLLTGGAGVLGSALVEQLLPDYRLICLSRKTPIHVDGVEQIHADISLPRLGLAQTTFDNLCAQTDWIIHSAAITRLTGKPQEIFTVNSLGTQNVLDAAQQARAPLYHISTAFTHPCDYYPGVGEMTPYEMAKRQAEQRVRDAGVPASIFRPSILIGNAGDGHMPQAQGLHATMALVMGGYLPILPCPTAGYVDVLARDVAASAIKSALDQRRIDEEHFLSSGAQAFSIGTLLTLIGQTMDHCGRPYQSPRCIEPEVYERLIKPVFLPSLQGPLKIALTRAIHMCRYVSLRSPLPSTLDQLLPAAQLAARSPTKEMLSTLAALTPGLDDLARHYGAGARRRQAPTSMESA